MSSQRGNTERSRPQKYKNRFGFKNDMHDKTPLTKFLNNLQVVNVCKKCKLILEWKIKYKKYKPIKTARKCTKCDEKSVKHAYHIMCSPCARKLNVCPKCGKNEEIVEKEIDIEEQIKLDVEMQQTIKRLSERKRRTFLRYMAKNKGGKKPVLEEDDTPAELTMADVKEKLEALDIGPEEEEDDEDDDFDLGSNDSDFPDSYFETAILRLQF